MPHKQDERVPGVRAAVRAEGTGLPGAGVVRRARGPLLRRAAGRPRLDGGRQRRRRGRPHRHPRAGRGGEEGEAADVQALRPRHRHHPNQGRDIFTAARLFHYPPSRIINADCGVV